MRYTHVKVQGNTVIILSVIVALSVIIGGLLFAPKSEDVIFERAEPVEQAIATATEGRSYRSRRVDLHTTGTDTQEGSAVVSERDDGISITISLKDVLIDATHPVHLQQGTCDNLGKVIAPLNMIMVTDQITNEFGIGQSQTQLSETFESIVGDLPHAINVHKSMDEAHEYIACGTIIPQPKVSEVLAKVLVDGRIEADIHKQLGRTLDGHNASDEAILVKDVTEGRTIKSIKTDHRISGALDMHKGATTTILQVQLAGLPELRPGDTYALWLVLEGEAPVPIFHIVDFSSGEDGTYAYTYETKHADKRALSLFVTIESDGPRAHPNVPIAEALILR